MECELTMKDFYKGCALVTAIGSFSAHAAIGSMRRMGYRVVGCDIYPGEWVVNSRDVDAFYQVPLATDSEKYIEALREIVEREKVDLMLPSTDYEVDALRELRDCIPAIICMSSNETLEVCRNKRLSYLALASQLNEVNLISTQLVADADLFSITYPAVCKPVDGRSSSGLFTALDANDVVNNINKRDFSRYCIQPKLSGRIVAVDVVRQGDAVVSVARRELLRTPNGAGTTVEVFQDAALDDLCFQIANILDVVGCVNFEFIEHEDGNYRFLECNPRLSGGVAFSIMSGYDMVKNHVRCFTGERVEALEHVVSQIIARRYTEYAMN